MFYKKFLLIFLVGTSMLASEEAIDEIKLREKMKTYSRQTGYSFAEALKNDSELFDLEATIQGIRAFMNGESSNESAVDLFDDTIFKAYEKQLFELKAQKNLEQAEQYLQTKTLEKTAHVLEDGLLLYEINEKGCSVEGQNVDALKEQDTVVADYTLFDTEGKALFSSKEMEGTTHSRFAVEDLLPALSRAMVGMQQGEKRTIYVHPNLAYGKIGHLPPNSLLIMEVKLIEIVQTPSPS